METEALEKAFFQLGKKEQFWQAQSRVLLAVSGGVDSMVLLHLMEKVQAQGVTIGIAHINHQLRPESQIEEDFLRKYCAEKKLAFYCRRWESLPTSGMEEAARKFRYQFFKEVLQEHHYDTLMTAHHSDDQLETMLMKMIREGNLQSAGGIKAKQSFAGGRLVRPLLTFPKEDLLIYAKEQGITYFEDATNTLLDVQRNRLRQQVVPLLKAENPQLLSHFNQLAQQLQWTVQWQQETLKAWFNQNAISWASGWRLPVAAFMGIPKGQRYFAVQHCLLVLRNQYQIPFNEEQLQLVLRCLESDRPQWSVDLAAGWLIQGEYQEILITKKQGRVKETSNSTLRLGEGVFLSATEWVALLAADGSGILPTELAKIPEKVKLWSEFSQALPVEFPTEVMFRKRNPGDRIQLTNSLRKKVSRIFIDKKIPNEMREHAWLMTDTNGQVLGVLPVVLSYLSIAKETDKIHYRLLYKYNTKNND